MVDLVYGNLNIFDVTFKKLLKYPGDTGKIFVLKNNEIVFVLTLDRFRLKFRDDTVWKNKRYEIIDIGGETIEESI